MHGQRLCIAFVLALALCAADAPAALAGPILTTVGPPFATGETPLSVAFSATGRQLASANAEDDSVSLFGVSASGVLSARSTVATGGRPTSVAFSPDGQLLATANFESDTVSMFSVSHDDLTPVAIPATTGDAPTSVAFSPDGGLLATANLGAGSVSVFKVSAVGELTAAGPPLVFGEVPSEVAFSPRGGLLVTSNGDLGSAEFGSLTVFSVTNAGVLTEGATTPTVDHPGGLAFSPDGGLLATANSPGVGADASVSVYSVSASGALAAVGAPTATAANPTSLAFSPGGDFLAIASFDDAVSVFSVSTAGVLAPVGSPAPTGSGPQSLAFDPSGGLLAIANSQGDSVSMFSVSAGGVLTPVGAPARTGTGPCSLQFSPSGGLLAAAGNGGEPPSAGSVSMFTVAADGILTSAGPPTPSAGHPCSLAFSPDGTLLATADGDGDSVSVFTVSPGGGLTAAGSTPLGDATDPYAAAVAFSPDGSLLAVTHRDGASGSLSTFTVSASGVLTEVGSVSTGDRPGAVVFHPDGGMLAVSEQAGVAMFSVSAGGALTPLGAPTSTGIFGPSTLSFSPTGGLLAAAAPNSKVMVFTVSDTGDLDLIEPPTVLDDFSSAVAFSPSGGLLAATSQQYLWLFTASDAGVLTAVGSPTPFSYDPVSRVAFSPDGTLLVAANWSYSTLSVHPLAAPRLDVAITSAPAAMTASTSAGFEFEANYPSTLECRLDAGSFEPCTTPASQAYGGLGEGPHAFAVRATDLLGNVEPSPASHSWIVDVTAPLDPALAQPASGAAHLPAAPLFEWSPTSDNLTGVDRYELWVDAVLSRTVPAASCAASCSATPEPLADGAHSWQVRGVDGAGNVAVSGSRPFSVDAAPPGAFALSSPADDAATQSRRPALSWLSAVDGGVGLSGYDVVLDDQVVASGLGAGATSFTPAGDLAEGVHGWHVVARDAYGNERASATWQLHRRHDGAGGGVHGGAEPRAGRPQHHV